MAAAADMRQELLRGEHSPGAGPSNVTPEFSSVVSLREEEKKKSSIRMKQINSTTSDRLWLQVEKIVHMPVRKRNWCGCRRAARNITVTVQEMAPSRKGRGAMPLPATFHFGEGVEEENFEVGWKSHGVVNFPKRFLEAHLEPGWRLRFEVFDKMVLVGYVDIDAVELANGGKERWRLLLSDNGTGDAVYDSQTQAHHDSTSSRNPTFVQVRVGCPSAHSIAREGNSFQSCSGSERSSSSLETLIGSGTPRIGDTRFRKRVMIMTRGTRGDVQPYVALARGLIMKHDCEVTIVTELAWKAFIVESKQGLPPGSLHFRPCGGDTPRQTRSEVAKLALRLGQHYDSLQAIMLSKSETNFFSSEGCFYYWAREERPDFIVFGFTVTHLAMLISEALHIPIVGFFLQPAHEIENRPKPQALRDQLLGPLRNVMNSTEFNAILMHIMQAIPDGGPNLNRLRRSRGLQPFPVGIQSEFIQYKELKEQRTAQVVPINPLVLSDNLVRHMQMEEGMTLTDFIFLRRDNDVLDDELLDFIADARSKRRQLIGITFSSMPIGERKIIELAVEICEKIPDATHDVALIAFIGGQEYDPVPEGELQDKVEQLSEEARLLVRSKGAAFGALFQELDAVILQGGLGTTSEAFLAGIPAVVSGILLMDQRYWAARVHELQCGPEGIYIDQMFERTPRGESRVVEVIRHALDIPSEFTYRNDEFAHSWLEKAKAIKELIAESRAGRSHDGVDLNAETVFEHGCNSRALQNTYAQYQGCHRGFARQFCCCLYSCQSCVQWIFCSQLPICILVQLQILRFLGVNLMYIAFGSLVGFGVAWSLMWLLAFIWSQVDNKDWKTATVVISTAGFIIWVIVGVFTAWALRKRVQVFWRDVERRGGIRTSGAIRLTVADTLRIPPESLSFPRVARLSRTNSSNTAAIIEEATQEPVHSGVSLPVTTPEDSRPEEASEAQRHD